MQLFGLVNALLSHNSRTVAANQSDFSIQRYAVMPLSPTVGECCVCCVCFVQKACIPFQAFFVAL